MKKGTIELTEEQAASLVEIIDIANKALGLKVAGNCLFFADLINKAFIENKELLKENK